MRLRRRISSRELVSTHLAIAGLFGLLSIVCLRLPAQSGRVPSKSPKQDASPQKSASALTLAGQGSSPASPPTERFTYHVEWRLIHAGQVVVEARPNWAQLKLDS